MLTESLKGVLAFLLARTMPLHIAVYEYVMIIEYNIYLS